MGASDDHMGPMETVEILALFSIKPIVNELQRTQVGVTTGSASSSCYVIESPGHGASGAWQNVRNTHSRGSWTG
jgi:hypothetical protein